MRFILIIVTFFSSVSFANNNDVTHDYLAGLSDQLHSFHQPYVRDDLALFSSADFSYVEGVGGMFLITYIEPVARFFQEQGIVSDAESIEQSPAVNAVKQKFVDTRLTLKSLSHQIYQLERQINSSKIVEHLSGNEVQELKQQLAALNRDKKHVNIQYMRAKTDWNQANKSTYNSEYHLSEYYRSLGNLLYAETCQANKSKTNQMFTASPVELIFIFKQAGDISVAGRYQDLVMRVPPSLLKKCAELNVNESTFKASLVTSHF